MNSGLTIIYELWATIIYELWATIIYELWAHYNGFTLYRHT